MKWPSFFNGLFLIKTKQIANMKKLFSILTILGVLFIACEREEDDNNSNNGNNNNGGTDTTSTGGTDTTSTGGGTGNISPCLDTPTEVVDVTNPTTGKTWMDRTLGASQAATSSTDSLAYGDLYQWGRSADGHQCRNSATTSTLSSTDDPGHGDFITSNSGNYDWRSPQNDNLWQGVNGTNNPCPSGYRLPTYAELDAELSSWSYHNAFGAFATPLKLPAAGDRIYSHGSFSNVGTNGYYWSSAVNGTYAGYLAFYSSAAGMRSNYRAFGLSVRCLKDQTL